MRYFIFFALWGLLVVHKGEDAQLLNVAPQKTQEEYDIHSIELKVYLWRDFQPIAPPKGKPLRVKVQITVPDSISPSSLEIEKLMLIHKNDTVTVDKDEFANSLERLPDGVRVVWRQGPYWSPNEFVDVWVWLRVGEKQIKKVARRQKIHATF